MNYSLSTFQTGVKPLEDFIKIIKDTKELYSKIRNLEITQQQDVLLLQDTKNLLSNNLEASNRIFEYNSIIISLYGLLESFVESLIKEYIEVLSSEIADYKDLPETIVNNHYELSAILISNLSQPKYKDVTTKEAIVFNLYGCINNGGGKYTVNVDAYTDHSANIRQSSLNEFFSKVGIKNVTSLVLQDNKFTGFLEEHGFDKQKPFEVLNDLAERRNRISHGSSIGVILDINELVRYVGYIKQLVFVLNKVVFEQTIPFLLKNGSGITKLDNIIDVFNDDILCLTLSGIKVKIGDVILFKVRRKNKGTIGSANTDGTTGEIEHMATKTIDATTLEDNAGIVMVDVVKNAIVTAAYETASGIETSIRDSVVVAEQQDFLYRSCQILSIQIDRVDYEDLKIEDESKNVGLRLSCNIKKDYEFYHVRKRENDKG